MNFRVGITDTNWFNFLSKIQPEDVNFWQPGGKGFKALEPGEPFVLKLKYPENKIAGVGFFFRYIALPISIAWDTFKERNGCFSFKELQKVILDLRSDKSDSNPEIGCIVLTNPVFFKRRDWIDVPADLAKNIVTGKNYNVESQTGAKLWNEIQEKLSSYLSEDVEVGNSLLELNEPSLSLYGSILSKVRIGQGAFRVSVTDAYQRRCSISGERTLPVLEAAHIKPYAESGPNFPRNGLLLRSDIHKLFDAGYLTITKELKIEVSGRIKAEFENGKEYYRYHGNKLAVIPQLHTEIPSAEFIDWHNLNIYRT